MEDKTGFVPLCSPVDNRYVGEDCVLKKCCKKYKKGNRCKKCPDR